MIASWLSHDNRKQRRTAKVRARRAGVELAIHRVTSDAVGEHIVALTLYLVSPSKARLDELAAMEVARNHVIRYIGSQKAVDDVSVSDIEAARQLAQAERVAQVLTRNILSSELDDIQFEMAVVAGMAPGSEDPIEHIVLSWLEGEHPSADQVEELLDILLAVAGLSRHQVYAVLHRDTDNDHLHVAVNRVDPVTGERVQIGRNIERSIETLHQAIAIIEHRQGWASQDNALYRADDTGCYDREAGAKVRDAAMQPCASDADRKRIRQWRGEQKVERKISSAARDFERRTGVESLQRRVIETAAPIFRDGRDWDTVHRSLAVQGMRYEMLTAGAQIVCGERDIAASTAWGGASAAKMVERLGAFKPRSSDIVVAPFEDRLIPKLHLAAEKRRARDALRADRAALSLSIDYAHDLIGARYRDTVKSDPLADTEALNDIRRRASAEVASLKEAVLLLEKQRRERLRRKRKALDDRGRVDPDESHDEVSGLLMGATAAPAPLVDCATVAEPSYDIVEGYQRRDYYRSAQLVFTERGDRIEIFADDDEALRQALRVAQAKWGSVSAIGDGRFLDRIARLAVEEGIAVTNPELQARMTRMRRNRELETRLDAIEARNAAQTAARSPVEPTQRSPLPAVLIDYAQDFTRWLERRADPAVARGRIDADACAILANPELRRQLAELESQQFEFAIELRRSAQRYSARQQKVWAELQAAWDDQPLEPFGRLPRLSDLMPRAEDLKRMPIEFAPVQPGVGPPIADIRKAAALDAVDEERELDHRYRSWAERARRKQAEKIDCDRAAALRARVDDPEAPPRHIARLLLREAARAGAPRSRFDRATDRRDFGEIAALSHDAMFAQMLVLARRQDAQLIRRLSGSDQADGDALGRVRNVRGRLDFLHVSEPGYDKDALPPREWIDQDLNAIDFTRIRLTRRDGLVGVTDPDLLDATHHNHVGLLYPDVQAKLELEWRLQHERDVAVLAKIAARQIIVSASINMTDRPHAWIDLPRGANDDERRRVATMAHDVEAFLALRACARGEGTAELPLDPSALASAYLRGRVDRADPAILDLMTARLQIELPGVEFPAHGRTYPGRPGPSFAPRRVGTGPVGSAVSNDERLNE